MNDPVNTSPLDAFNGRIEPTRVSFFYQMGLGVVALTMILLPLVYVVLIVAMGKLVWWHLENDVGIFEHVQGRGALIALVLYLGPAIAGAIFILFLIKPLFSRSAKPVPNFKVNEADEPLLFGFVKKICQLVGAPIPREIRLDTQVNASAGFRRGGWSFFGNDLVLVIGLPLAAGMTTRQLAGVLAHEFGHFAQGAGMRFSYIIRRVNGWFARVVYERDHWDQKLDDWARTDSWWLKGVFMLAQGGVWLGRKVLWCLMHVGHTISCFMSRQMEFDADSYEAKLAGSTEFARTAERLRALSVAHGAAMNDAYQTYQTKTLPDDLPALVVWREQMMPADVRENLEKQAAESKTQWNQTHPADPDRVKEALALKAEGVFHLETPASSLFSNFAATSQAVTRHYFQHELDVATDKVQFRSAAKMVQDRQAADDSDKHLDAFFGKQFHFLRMKPVQTLLPGTWSDAAEQMKSAEPGYGDLLAKYHQLQDKQGKQSIGGDLINGQFTLPKPDEFALMASTSSSAEIGLKQTQAQIHELGTQMAVFETAALRRMGAALEWRLRHPQEEGDKLRVEHLLAAQNALAQVLPDLMHAARSSRSLQLLFDNAANHHDGYALERYVKSVAQRIEVAANRCITTLGDAAHPYLEEHPPIAQVLNLPEKGDNEYARAFKLAQVCSDALIPLFVRVMGDLSGIALAAEKELEKADLPNPYAPENAAVPVAPVMAEAASNLPAPGFSEAEIPAPTSTAA
ncbi:MAG: M48 family metalloprotease [Verrucomicrobiota bacterium]